MQSCNIVTSPRAKGKNPRQRYRRWHPLGRQRARSRRHLLTGGYLGRSNYEFDAEAINAKYKVSPAKR